MLSLTLKLMIVTGVIHSTSNSLVSSRHLVVL